MRWLRWMRRNGTGVPERGKQGSRRHGCGVALGGDSSYNTRIGVGRVRVL
ncbi:MAG: hypothetical protein IPF98_04570 [Gemmatimonadetes bacterium]|nr:hypothetical protein [Gemmatimonadota bacterium]